MGGMVRDERSVSTRGVHQRRCMPGSDKASDIDRWMGGLTAILCYAMLYYAGVDSAVMVRHGGVVVEGRELTMQ